jgi:pimeloyl-ACP methyl ester carboxylesterase
MKLEEDLRHLRIPTTGGPTLHAVTAGPEDGPLVVLLHGFPEFWFSWRHQIRALADAGYRVVAPDQRGYNESDKPEGRRRYRIQFLAQDVVDVIDSFGREKAHAVIGHDWGGAVTWEVAASHAHRVDRVAVLNCPPIAVLMRNLVKNPRQLRRSWYVFFFQLPRLADAAIARASGNILRQTSNPGSFTDDDVARYVEAWRKPGAATAMLNWYRAGLLVRPTKKRVQVPALIVWGKRDHALGPELAEEAARLCDDGRLVWIEDATHWVQHDAPDRVNALLLEHLAR